MTNRNRLSTKCEAILSHYTYNYLNILPKSPDSRIVDLGCSEGIALEWLLSHGYKNIVGIDSDQGAINIAKKRLNGNMDINQIIFIDALSYLQKCKDNSIDMIMMLNVIEHFSKATILEIILEIKRTLKPKGYFLAQTGNWENPLNIGLFTRDFTHQVMYTKNSLKQLMMLSGFSATKIQLKPVRYKTSLHNLPLQVLAPFTGWLLKMLALSMRIHIHETSPLIYCLAKK